MKSTIIQRLIFSFHYDKLILICKDLLVQLSQRQRCLCNRYVVTKSYKQQIFSGQYTPTSESGWFKIADHCWAIFPNDSWLNSQQIFTNPYESWWFLTNPNSILTIPNDSKLDSWIPTNHNDSWKIGDGCRSQIVTGQCTTLQKFKVEFRLRVTLGNAPPNPNSRLDSGSEQYWVMYQSLGLSPRFDYDSSEFNSDGHWQLYHKPLRLPRCVQYSIHIENSMWACLDMRKWLNSLSILKSQKLRRIDQHLYAFKHGMWNKRKGVKRWRCVLCE